jgi:raffinose/stachyose/melibiose transport system substrate-binding protein
MVNSKNTGRLAGKFVTLILAMGVLVFSACSKKQVEATGEKRLKIWHAAFNVMGEDEKPESEWLITKLFQAFEAANPGIKIDGEYIEDQQVLQTRLKAAVLAGDAPDIANIYSGFVPTSLKDILLDIRQYIPKEDREMISGWNAVSENLKDGSPIFGYPITGNELGCIPYNKKLVSAAGVDLEGPGKPKNAQEFVAALQKIKDTGVAPLITGDSGFNAAYIFAFSPWWIQQTGIDRVTSNSLGITKFIDDTAFIESLTFVQNMYKEGLINPDYLTNETSMETFRNGGAALVITGNWDIETTYQIMGDNLGLYVVPPFKEGLPHANTLVGGVGQAMVVLKSSKIPEIAVDFLHFLSNKENTITIVKSISKIPFRSDITAQDIGWTGIPIFEKLLNITNENDLHWIDNAMQPDVMTEYYKQSSLVVVNQLSAADCARLLDQKAASVNSGPN